MKESSNTNLQINLNKKKKTIQVLATNPVCIFKNDEKQGAVLFAQTSKLHNTSLIINLYPSVWNTSAWNTILRYADCKIKSFLKLICATENLNNCKEKDFVLIRAFSCRKKSN